MKKITFCLLGLCTIGLGLFALPGMMKPAEGQPPQGETEQGFGPPGFGPPGFGPAGFGPPPIPAMMAIDTDGDGELSAEELAKAPEALRTLDANGDKKLTEDELIPPFMQGFGPGGPGGPFGPGGPGSNRKLVDQFDTDKDGRLNAAERAEARKSAPQRQGGRGGRGGPGGPGGPGMAEAPKPGKRIDVNQVQMFTQEDLYDTKTLRTLFLDFDAKDWEEELAAFNNTDVEVPATLTVDGKKYPDVGVHFRGLSSYMMVPAGYKRSLNLTMDFVDKDQRLYGYKTLNLLNAHEDDSLMSSVLYSKVANQYIPAPKANFVRVVINGENWGVYVNVQQFNKDFLKDHFSSTGGARWKVSGNPGADGGLRYVGENVDDYKRRYDLKTKEDEKAWKALIKLCKTLDETPADQLEAKLSPMLDIDNALWFLALDCALVNNDGYWVRSSDYSIYLDDQQKFHLIPHDMNEAFHGMMGPPGGGPARGGMGRGNRGGRAGGPGQGGPGQGGPGAPGFPGGPGPEQAGGFPGGPGGGFPGGGFPGGGPGFGGRGMGGRMGGPGGMGGGGVELDPLVAMNDAGKPLRSKLLQVPALRERYLRYIKTIAQHSLTWDNLGPFIAEMKELISEDVQADTRKLETYEAFVAATSDKSSNERGGRTMNLRSFIDQRSQYLLKHGEIQPLEPVPLPELGKKAKPASPSTEKLAPLKRTGKSPVVINEVLAANTQSIKDPQGEFEDYVELYNSSDQSVDLSGKYLSDSPKALRKWKFPAGTNIGPGEFLVLWADEDSDATNGLHLNFKLSSKGETVLLIDSDSQNNTILDVIKFESQKSDIAFGRDTPDRDQWHAMPPSAGKPNRLRE